MVFCATDGKAICGNPCGGVLAAVVAADAGKRDRFGQPGLHVLNRLAFGPTFDDFSYVKMVGVDRYIAEQLDPAKIAEPVELRFVWLSSTRSVWARPNCAQLYGPLRPVAGVKPSLDDIKAQQQRASVVFRRG